MKLNKMKIARLTNSQAKSVKGGYVVAESTQHNFTCGWCTGGDGPTMDTCPNTAEPSPMTKP